MSIPDIAGTDNDLRNVTNFVFLTGDPTNPTFLALESLQGTTLTIMATLVPEPSTAVLCGIGLLGLGERARRRA